MKSEKKDGGQEKTCCGVRQRKKKLVIVLEYKNLLLELALEFLEQEKKKIKHSKVEKL